MGLYDNIQYSAKCEECGNDLKDFQSKDGPCVLKHLSPSDVDYFYCLCEKCGTWHDFKVHRVSYVKDIDVTIIRKVK